MNKTRMLWLASLIALGACADESSNEREDDGGMGNGGLDGGGIARDAAIDALPDMAPDAPPVVYPPCVPTTEALTASVRAIATTRDDRGEIIRAYVDQSSTLHVSRFARSGAQCVRMNLPDVATNASTAETSTLSVAFDAQRQQIAVAYMVDRSPSTNGADVVVATMGASATTGTEPGAWTLTPITSHGSGSNPDGAAYPVLRAHQGRVVLAYVHHTTCMADRACTRAAWVDNVTGTRSASADLPAVKDEYDAALTRPDIAFSDDGELGIAWFVATNGAHGRPAHEGKLFFWKPSYGDIAMVGFISETMFSLGADRRPALALSHDGTNFMAAAYMRGPHEGFGPESAEGNWVTYTAKFNPFAVPDGVIDGSWEFYDKLPDDGQFSSGGSMRLLRSPHGQMVLVGQRVRSVEFPQERALRPGPIVHYLDTSGIEPVWKLGANTSEVVTGTTDASGAFTDAVFAGNDDDLVVTYGVDDQSGADDDRLQSWVGRPTSARVGPEAYPCVPPDGWSNVFETSSTTRVYASSMATDVVGQPLVVMAIPESEMAGAPIELVLAYYARDAVDECQWHMTTIATGVQTPQTPTELLSTVDIAVNSPNGMIGVAYEMPTMIGANSASAVHVKYGFVSPFATVADRWTDKLIEDPEMGPSDSRAPVLEADNDRFVVAYQDQCGTQNSDMMCMWWPTVSVFEAYSGGTQEFFHPLHYSSDAYVPVMNTRLALAVPYGGDSTPALAWIVNIEGSNTVGDIAGKIFYWQQSFGETHVEYAMYGDRTLTADKASRVGLSLAFDRAHVPVFAATFDIADDVGDPPSTTQVILRSRRDPSTLEPLPTDDMVSGMVGRTWADPTTGVELEDGAYAGAALSLLRYDSVDGEDVWRLAVSHSAQSSAPPFSMGPMWYGSETWATRNVTHPLGVSIVSPSETMGIVGEHLQAALDDGQRLMIVMNAQMHAGASIAYPYAPGAVIWHEPTP